MPARGIHHLDLVRDPVERCCRRAGEHDEDLLAGDAVGEPRRAGFEADTPDARLLRAERRAGEGLEARAGELVVELGGGVDDRHLEPPIVNLG